MAGTISTIRAAGDAEWPGIWRVFRPVVEAGDTYPYAPDTDEAEARRLWMAVPGDLGGATYVALGEAGDIAGTYYLRANQPALGAHVANAGYMVHPDHRRRGIGRAMGEHSLTEARRLGFTAMQFNLVVATNEASVRLWRGLGFDVVGRLPGAFRHKTLGAVDALVMYRTLPDLVSAATLP